MKICRRLQKEHASAGMVNSSNNSNGDGKMPHRHHRHHHHHHHHHQQQQQQQRQTHQKQQQQERQFLTDVQLLVNNKQVHDGIAVQPRNNQLPTSQRAAFQWRESPEYP